MKRLILAVIAVAAFAVGTTEAKETTIAGTWTMTIEHLGLKLELQQTKSTVTGALDWPHGDPIKLTGAFAGETLLLSGDSTGPNFTIHVDATGTRKADGTVAGVLKAHFDEFNDEHQVVRVRNQEMPWTAWRGLHNIVHFPR
jgi:hypothetical protein